MSDKMIENNQVTVMGEIVTPFSFSHEVFGEGFYMVEVDVKRLSNSKDRIPLMISERLIDVTKDYTGEFIMVNGQFRSYNRHEEMKNRLILSVLHLWKKNLTVQRRIRFFWMVISANSLFTVRHRLAERLQIYCWQ